MYGIPFPIRGSGVRISVRVVQDADTVPGYTSARCTVVVALAATIGLGLLNAFYVGAMGGTVTICRGRTFVCVQDRVLCALRSDYEHEPSTRSGGVRTVDGMDTRKRALTTAEIHIQWKTCI